MESAEERQEAEVTALKSIYSDDFIKCPPPKVWQAAARLPEFIIRVTHPDPSSADKVFFNLHVKFPKTYPALAGPIISVEKPVQGLSPAQVTKLSRAIHAEVQKNKGTEMVFQVIEFAQDWLNDNVRPPTETPGSLAIEMSRRAMDEEKIRQEEERARAERELEKAKQLADELNEQIQADVQRHQQEKEQYYRTRRRAPSDATEVPSAGDTPTESFAKEIELDGVRFNTVKMFRPRKECLGTVYIADPVCDDVNATLPLELHVVNFESDYYKASQGRKKLRQVEAEIEKLSNIRHPNVLSVYAVKLVLSQSNSPSRLVILLEQRPSLSLYDVLEDTESIREDRASDYFRQILTALHVIHSSELVHRGLNLRCIGLAARNFPEVTRLVKVGKIAYYIRLLDMHRSDPFGDDVIVAADEFALPESWLPKDVIESPLLYTRSRDIHGVGVILLQMLLGSRVIERFSDAHAALQSSPISHSLRELVSQMLLLTKRKAPSCLSLLSDLNNTSFHTASTSLPISIPAQSGLDAKTPVPRSYGSSPEVDYFRMPSPRPRQVSRWKEDWEELELLGKGGFGSVVKARNKIDNRVYAVKKIRLKASPRDSKIFREVNALSRLNHRFIVRYYTTWVETADSSSIEGSPGPDTDSDASERTSLIPGRVSQGNSNDSNDPFGIDLNDLSMASASKGSFPSIHFTRSNSPIADSISDESEDSNEAEDLFELDEDRPVFLRPQSPPAVTRTLYIQMEFVERQTLKERIAEGLSEDEAWRLFLQIVDALVHMSSLGILHRDIKLTNIFIDGNGDCKVGDFGLATSSLAAVDPSDLSGSTTDGEMTLEVGTRLYIAPEVLSAPKKGPRNHSKADIYSLGIVFFEMNYTFSTGSERIAVLEELRRPEILFPEQWPVHRARQRQIITWLLQHDPRDRPSAIELSQSPVLPPRVEDEYFKDAVRMMAKRDSPHYQAVLSALFSQPSKASRAFLYDIESSPEHSALNGIVEDTLTGIFQLHGAVDLEPPLLIPVVNPEEERNRVLLLDRHGEIVSLPHNALVPFARSAAHGNIRRIKRYHIGDTYRPNPVAGHPRSWKTAMFDIITPDIKTGSVVSTAEAIVLVDMVLSSFPGISQTYEIHISHSRIVDLALERVPKELRPTTIDIMTQTKSSVSQKRALLLKKGILRSTADELEALNDIDDDIDAIMDKIDKVSQHVSAHITPLVQQIKSVIEHANLLGVTRPIFFHPLMLSGHNSYFKDGVCFEVVKRHRRSDILAAGGRYDRMISQFTAPKSRTAPVYAVGLQLSLERITLAVASYQSTSVGNLVKEQRSFGFWSPRRCDVYIVSYQPFQLRERLEAAALLWQNGIRADLMYESGLPESEDENHTDVCAREGILFTVCPRPYSARRDQPAFKVKSVLRGTEYDLSRQELVSWLQQQISQQKRMDGTTSGVPIVSSNSNTPQTLFNKGEHAGGSGSGSTEVQLLLPAELKKPRKQTKGIFIDRAFEKANQLKAAAQSGLPVLAIDVPPAMYDAMIRSSAWIRDDEAYRALLLTGSGQVQTGYANQIREAVGRRKEEGWRFLVVFAVRDERVQVLGLE